ncbi:MAG: hypothetical protein ACOCUI_04595 [bacterium]
MKKLLLILLLIPFVSAYSQYDIVPSQLLENEWFVFISIFFIVFAFLYISLSRVFTSKSKNPAMPWLVDEKTNKGPVVAISIALAFLITSAFIRYAWLQGVLGDVITGWLMAGLILFLLFMIIPFYNKLSKSKYGIYAPIFLAILLFVGWVFLNSYDIYQLLPYTLISYEVERLFEFLSSWLGLIIMISICLVLFIMKKLAK